ncbi:MAG: M48 family metallopeptidase [Deltaproteobacteria bacterium]|nr:M48 family metallopeptidase [Deltaproteobacteria bacterium]
MSQDFFQRQEETRRQSRRFFMAFAASVAAAVVVFYLVVTGCLMVLFITLIPEISLPPAVLAGRLPLPQAIYGDPPRVLAFRPFLMVGSGILLIIASACFYKIRAIKNGGGFYVAVMLGGRLLEKPGTFKERQLVNVVEEMALAAGLPRPEIFIMDQEPGINAVTAGLDPEDAVISVTAGALEHLDRDELQGVVAHEFAHILNGDCALNLTMAGWLYGLLVFHAVGKGLLAPVRRRRTMASSRGGGRGVALVFILGLILMAGGWLGKLFAELVQAALSRTREFLADAGAVQFTRNPPGLAGALKKIAAFPGALHSGQALALQSFFFASLSRGWSLFRSHPPLADRILALTPDWDGQWPAPAPPPPAPKAAVKKAAAGSYPAAVKRLGEQLRDLPRDWSGATLLALAGGLAGPVPNPAEAGRRLFESLPEELRAAAQDQAPLLAVAVFIQNEEPEIEARQAALIQAGGQAARRAVALRRLMSEEIRLPLLSLAAPALKRLPAPEKEKLGRLIQALIAADGRLSLFEVAAAQTLKKSLGLSLSSSSRSALPSDPAPPHEFSRQLQSDAALLLSALAHVGSDDPEAARAAFRAGAAHLSSQWPPLAFRPRAEIKIRDLPPLLDRLTQAPGKIKCRLTAAAVACAYHDRKITPRECELLRALGAAFDRPLPMLEHQFTVQPLTRQENTVTCRP